MALNTLALSGPSAYLFSSQRPSLDPLSPCYLQISRRRGRKVSQFRAILPRRQAILALQKSDGDEFRFQELADGSLLFSFGPDDNGTNEVQLSFEKTESLQLPPRPPSRFRKRNPIPPKKKDIISSQQSQDEEEVLPSLEKVETAVTQFSNLEGDSSPTFSAPPRLPSRFLKSSPIPIGARKLLRPPPTPPNIVSITSSNVSPPSTTEPSASLSPISRLNLEEPPHSEVLLDSSVSLPLPPSSNHIHLSQSSVRGSISSPVASFVSNSHVSSSNGAAFSLQPAVSSIPQTPVRLTPSGIKTSPITRPTTRRNASSTEGSFSTFNEVGRSVGDLSIPSRPPSAFVKRSPISDRSPSRDTPSKANGTSTSAVTKAVSHTETSSENAKKETSRSSSPRKRATKKSVKASDEGVSDHKVEAKTQTASRPASSFVRRSPIPALTPLRSPPVALTSSKKDIKSTPGSEEQVSTPEDDILSIPVSKSLKKSSKGSKTMRKTRAGASKGSVSPPAPVAKEGLVSSSGSAIEEIPPSTSDLEDTDDDKPEDKAVETQKSKVVKRRTRKPKVEVAAKTEITPVEEETSRLKERAALNGVALTKGTKIADSPIGVGANEETNTKNAEGFNPPEITPTDVPDTSGNKEEKESTKEKPKRVKKKKSPVESAKDSVAIPEEVVVDSDTEDGTEETVQGKDYKSLTLSSLRELAKDKGLKGFSKLKKAELVDALVKSEAS